MEVGSTQSLMEMSIRIIGVEGGGKGAPCLGLSTLPHSFADCVEIWQPSSPGRTGACPSRYENSFSHCFRIYVWVNIS
jgi:hypothetical protein